MVKREQGGPKRVPCFSFHRQRLICFVLKGACEYSVNIGQDVDRILLSVHKFPTSQGRHHHHVGTKRTGCEENADEYGNPAGVALFHNSAGPARCSPVCKCCLCSRSCPTALWCSSASQLQMLDENAKLIAAIVENQNMGKLDQCIE